MSALAINYGVCSFHNCNTHESPSEKNTLITPDIENFIYKLMLILYGQNTIEFSALKERLDEKSRDHVQLLL